MKRILILAPLAVASVLALGCASSATGTEKSASALEPATAPARDGRMSPVDWMEKTLADAKVPLRADQKTQIDNVFKEASTAQKERTRKLAAQVEAGKIDRAALGERYDVHAKIEAILDAAQKQALADARQQHMGRHHGPDGDEQGRAHAFKDGPGGPGGHGHEFKGKDGEGGMHHKLADLNLTDDQRQKIHEAMKADHKADNGPPPGEGRPFAHRGDHMIRFFEVAVPILTPEQRTKLAADLRARADANPATK